MYLASAGAEIVEDAAGGRVNLAQHAVERAELHFTINQRLKRKRKERERKWQGQV